MSRIDQLVAQRDRINRQIEAELLRERLKVYGYGKVQVSPRQREVLDLLLANKGISDKEIAAKLSISTRAACFHVLNVLKKFGKHSRREL